MREAKHTGWSVGRVLASRSSGLSVGVCIPVYPQ